ncbi:ABC transporter permease [Halocatena pleomorpha]|uniref:ABC transporter permease n=1 Tax=Halocatena pleomorpha TaxID=1785090 RepID=A0A3P3R9D2_9EURY|nr:ABC transporter permease [Halocatena pleomorpha]RRJ29143.1 ABC transporter permease [Halocatena pleomorpha]
MSRWQYFLRRVVLAVPVVFFAMSLVFLVIRAGPRDPVAAALGQNQNPEIAHRMRVQMGIINPDGTPVPLWEQYIDFMTDLVTLSLGQTWVINRGASVLDLIIARAPITIWLGFWSVLIALLIGIPLGFYAGLRPNTFPDYFASFGGIVWRAMPNFWLAIILSSVLVSSEGLTEDLIGVPLSWSDFLIETDVIGTASLANLGDPVSLIAAVKWILPPAIVLGSASMGNEMRIGRTAVLETINSAYVETARAKGLGRRVIVWKHVFRNALIPLVPVISSEAFVLIGGSVLVETVFAINGLGKLTFDAVKQGDLALAGGLLFVFAIFLQIVNIVQDLLYTLIDPRIGYDQS